YDIDADKMMEVMRIGREKLVDKGTTSANKRVDPLKSQTQMPRLEIIDSFMRHFQRRYDTELSDYTETELETARNLVEKKVDTKEWTHRVPSCIARLMSSWGHGRQTLDRGGRLIPQHRQHTLILIDRLGG